MKKSVNWIVACCIIISLILPGTVWADVNNEATYSVVTNETKDWPVGPELSSDTAVLMEAETGVVLYDKGMNETRYPASITKIMTTLLALENCSLDEQVTFTESGIRNIAEGSNIQMQNGEVLTMEQCLYAIMIHSANEVASQVAEYVGGSEEQFVAMMNDRAGELGCTNTHFNNPSGLPDENHWTTAYDMACVFREAIKNEEFCKIIGTLQYTIPATNLNPTERNITSHHALIVPSAPEYYEGCLGGKTGVTDASKNTLVTGVERDGVRYIAVVMRADPGQVCADTGALFDYAYNNFEKMNVDGGTLIIPKGTTETDLQVVDAKTDKEVFNSYYFNEYPVGTATLSIEELEKAEAQKEEERIQEQQDAKEQEEQAEEVKDTAEQSESIENYRIIILVLSVLILLSLLLIIVKSVTRKSKRK